MTKKHFDAFCSLRSQKEGESGSFFGLCPKIEPLSLPFRTSEASAKRDLLFCHVLSYKTI